MKRLGRLIPPRLEGKPHPVPPGRVSHLRDGPDRAGLGQLQLLLLDSPLPIIPLMLLLLLLLVLRLRWQLPLLLGRQRCVRAAVAVVDAYGVLEAACAGRVGEQEDSACDNHRKTG